PWQPPRTNQVRKLWNRLGNTNDTGDRQPSRSDAAAGGEENLPAVARSRRDLLSDCRRRNVHLPDRARAVLPRVPAGFYGVARSGARFDGDSDDSPPDRRRLWHGDSPHFGRGHAHVAAAGVAVHTFIVRREAYLSLGDAARVNSGRAHPRATGEKSIHHANLPDFSWLLHSCRHLLRRMESFVFPALQVVQRN